MQPYSCGRYSSGKSSVGKLDGVPSPDFSNGFKTELSKPLKTVFELLRLGLGGGGAQVPEVGVARGAGAVPGPVERAGDRRPGGADGEPVEAGPVDLGDLCRIKLWSHS